jgi:hypothetical protein
MRKRLARDNARTDRQSGSQTASDTGTDTRAAAVSRTISWARAITRRRATRDDRSTAAILLINSGCVTPTHDGPHYRYTTDDEQDQTPRNRGVNL